MSLVTDEIDLRRWASELEAAAVIASRIANTAFLPDSHRRFYHDDHGRLLDGKDGRPYRLDVEATTATAAAAIMTGAELGLKPSAALRSITVINNTPALSALALRAILQHAGHDIWVAESTATKAVVRARRAGDGEVQASTWTIDRAKTAGLYPGPERGQWRRNPTAMLVARASAEAARYVASDAILGIPYVIEELIDEIESPAPVAALEAGVAVPTPRGEAAVAALPGPPAADGDAPKKRRRKTAAPPPPLPTGPPAAAAEVVEAEVVDDDDDEGGDPLGLDGGTEVVDEATGEGHVEPASNQGAKREPPEVAAANARPVPPEPEADRGKITKPMLDKLHAELRALGLADDRELALGLVRKWAGRDVASSRDLTVDEAHAVLDRLGGLRALADGLEFIGVNTPEDGLALTSAWAGRPIATPTDLTGDELSAVLERLESLRSIARKPEGEAD